MGRITTLVISVEAAADLLYDGATMSTEGFTTTLFPEYIGDAVIEKFVKQGHPRNIGIFASGGKGDGDKTDLGLNKFAKAGLVGKILISHMGTNRKIEELAFTNEIEAYCLPQGVICQLFRAKACGQPGILSRIGIGTFVDPRVSDESRVNKKARDTIVEVLNVGGEDYLFYKTHAIDVAYLKGSIADENGNVSIEREPLNLDVLNIAMAAKASGGKVVFQVENVVKAGTLRARQVKVPGVCVDHVVIAPPEKHRMSKLTYYNPAYAGDIKVCAPPRKNDLAGVMDRERIVIQRRAAFELAKTNGVVNFGIGLPDGVDAAASAMGLEMGNYVTTVESGIIGGFPNSGDEFGTACSPDAIIDAVDMFGLYDGMGIELAILGMGEADVEGNVNVTKFGKRVPGPGGFINISASAKKVVFLGTFTAKGLAVEIADGKLAVVQEGVIKKFVKRVQQISFSGRQASLRKKEVIYITERAVFRLENGKIVLTEIAPGVDRDRDVISRMEFAPEISAGLKEMDERIFRF